MVQGEGNRGVPKNQGMRGSMGARGEHLPSTIDHVGSLARGKKKERPIWKSAGAGTSGGWGLVLLSPVGKGGNKSRKRGLSGPSEKAGSNFGKFPRRPTIEFRWGEGSQIKKGDKTYTTCGTRPDLPRNRGERGGGPETETSGTC